MIIVTRGARIASLFRHVACGAYLALNGFKVGVEGRGISVLEAAQIGRLGVENMTVRTTRDARQIKMRNMGEIGEPMFLRVQPLALPVYRYPTIDGAIDAVTLAATTRRTRLGQFVKKVVTVR